MKTVHRTVFNSPLVRALLRLFAPAGAGQDFRALRGATKGTLSLWKPCSLERLANFSMSAAFAAEAVKLFYWIAIDNFLTFFQPFYLLYYRHSSDFYTICNTKSVEKRVKNLNIPQKVLKTRWKKCKIKVFQRFGFNLAVEKQYTDSIIQKYSLKYAERDVRRNVPLKINSVILQS